MFDFSVLKNFERVIRYYRPTVNSGTSTFIPKDRERDAKVSLLIQAIKLVATLLLEDLIVNDERKGRNRRLWSA